jgi:hypothetical protein
MRLEVLHVADCPNVSTLLQRLSEVTELPVSTHQIETEAEAVQFGMAGSPTLLIDGLDPFATPGERAGSVSCRLYRDQDNRIVPVPPVEQLRDAIAAAGQPSVLSPRQVPGQILEQAEAEELDT